MFKDTPSLVPQNQVQLRKRKRKLKMGEVAHTCIFLRSWAFVLMTETAKDVWDADAPNIPKSRIW